MPGLLRRLHTLWDCAYLYADGPESENQIREIKAAGFAIEPHRIITETVSGSVAISGRKGFSRLLDKMESGDVLVVTKLDRLGRDAVDVTMTMTVVKLEKRVFGCIALLLAVSI